MKVLVDLLPRDVSLQNSFGNPSSNPYQDVVVLIDTLPCATLAAIMFDRGVSKLSISSSTRTCLEIAKTQNALLVGEARGRPLEGFNYGMSAKRMLKADIQDKAIAMHARSLPRALHYTAGAKHVLLASLYNAEAVVKKAAELAETEIALVCCGFALSEDLDDTFTAGYLAARLKQSYNYDLYGAAPMAMALLKAFSTPLEALWNSHTGSYLREYHIRGDIAVASRVSVSDSVARLVDKVDTLVVSKSTTESEWGNLSEYSAIDKSKAAWTFELA